MKEVNILFPNQLFQESPLFDNNAPFYLVEEFLFFKQYPFHKQKIAFHRATMKRYADFLKNEKNLEVHYVESADKNSDIILLIPHLKFQGVESLYYIDPVDNWPQKRLDQGLRDSEIQGERYSSPMFLNSKEDLASFFRSDKKKYHQTTFYIEQRKKRNILMDSDGKPMGGKWTFDTENRKKYPAKKIPPSIQFPETDSYFEEAKSYVAANFSNHLGELTGYLLYPNSFSDSRDWLNQFLEQRFSEFGIYEDAIECSLF